MGQPVNLVDDGTIANLISAFEVAMANTNAAQASVDSIGGALNWSGRAATEYRNALSNWVSGLQKVKQGLDHLNNSMTSHLGISGDAEDTASEDAKWYA